MPRTRIKICGLTRADDVLTAADAGADAVGFVCYERSPRQVAFDRLRELARALPPFVTPVLLFVNAATEQIRECLAVLPQALLQFHGDETPEQCEAIGRPYVRALRMDAGVDLLDCERRFPSAMASMVDAPSVAYGGSGTTFDWQRIPAPTIRSKPLILAGGLRAENVAEAIAMTQPFAVDVSSGVESVPGIKSAERIRQFIAAVRAADAANK